ncbi:MAG: hypothetical protein IT229_06445, partial [Flavobacteriales bacterium]|nr:hypothetical protein [Flavobacteriales bacterium]
MRLLWQIAMCFVLPLAANAQDLSLTCKELRKASFRLVQKCEIAECKGAAEKIHAQVDQLIEQLVGTKSDVPPDYVAQLDNDRRAL